MNSYTIQFIKSHIGELISSIPTTIYFNFKVLPFKEAIKFPFMVSRHVKIRGVNRNSFVVKSKSLPTASMRIGFGDSLTARRESLKGLISIQDNGRIVVGKDLGLSQGCVLSVKNGCITLENHFRCNYSTTIDCAESDITFGNDVVCGWNVTIKNSDGHTVIYDNRQRPQSKTIQVGDHVWICAFATILKGTIIGSDSIVAYGSLLSKTIEKNGVLYGGVPARVIRENVNWKE